MAFAPTRVHGSTLDAQKTWILLKEDMCGCRPRDFASKQIFKEFPEEIQYIPRTSLTEWREEGQRPLLVPAVLKQPHKVYVCSTFGFFAGMLRLREFPSNGFLNSDMMKKAIEALNTIDIFGAKPTTQPTTNTDSNIDVNTDKVNQLKLKISKLEDELREYKNYLFDDQRIPSKPLKKREAAQRSRLMFTHLNDVCNKNKESVASVLGSYFCFGTEDEQDEVRDIISDVANTIMKAKEGGLAEVFSDEMWKNTLQEMRVPDWALLYFKLKARLPDDAWQTMLNVTKLGRSGVSFPLSHLFNMLVSLICI